MNGSKLQMLRRDAKISQNDIAEQLGVRAETISSWETGKTAPTVDQFLHLSHILGFEADRLYRAVVGK